MRALQSHHTQVEHNRSLQRAYDELKAQLAATQVAQQQAEAQVAALTQLHKEVVGTQFTQLAETLTMAHRTALHDTALLTARAVRRELRGPGAKQQRATLGRRRVSPRFGRRR